MASLHPLKHQQSDTQPSWDEVHDRRSNGKTFQERFSHGDGLRVAEYIARVRQFPFPPNLFSSGTNCQPNHSDREGMAIRHTPKNALPESIGRRPNDPRPPMRRDLG
ncbi:MAG: hypothetical protein M1839_007003 [Geoglossum umbratile]|nr:MAG: hypothetical protein M1839_007003 [Geoglossum umbratile]